MTLGRCWAVAVGAVALSACGSSGPGALRAADRARLHADVSIIRRDSQAGQVDAARSAIGALRGEVSALARSGRLNAADAAALQVAAAQAQALLRAAPTTRRAPSTSRTPTPPAAPATPAPAHGHGKGHGHGPGHDKKQADGGD